MSVAITFCSFSRHGTVITSTNHEWNLGWALDSIDEREVAKLAAEGATNRQIAEALQISIQEVKRCLDALFGRGRGEG